MPDDNPQEVITPYKNLREFYKNTGISTNSNSLEYTDDEKSAFKKYNLNNRLRREGKPYEELTKEEHELYKSHERKKHRKRRQDPIKRGEENKKRRAWSAKKRKEKAGIKNKKTKAQNPDMDKFLAPSTSKNYAIFPERKKTSNNKNASSIDPYIKVFKI